MNKFEISKNKFSGAIALNSLFPSSVRARSLAICGAATIIFLALAAIRAGFAFAAKGLPSAVISKIPAADFLPDYTFFIGAAMIFSAPLLVLLALEGFANSKTGEKGGPPGASLAKGGPPGASLAKGGPPGASLAKGGDSAGANTASRLNFYASELWMAGPGFSRNSDTDSFFDALPQTEIGNSFLMRLGIVPEIYQEFRQAQKKQSEAVPLINLAEELTPQTQSGNGEEITFTDLLSALFGQNGPKIFFDTRSVPAQTIRRTAEWLEHEFMKQDRKRRWWLRENLARVPGFGKDWAYGSTPLLQKFAYDLSDEAVRMEGAKLIGKQREIEILESALLKQSGANVIIVGEAGAGKYTTLLGLVRMIAWGQIFPQLEHKRVFKLQGSALIASGKTKGEIEELLIRLMNEAVGAGNIILAIDEFPEFVDSLAKTGTNAVEILSPYLSGSGVHIIALGDALSFRRIIENNAGLMKYFARIDITEPEGERLLEILEEHVPNVEYAYGARAVFTYPALEKIAQSSTENLVQGALPKRAIDLMEEVMKEAISRGMFYVTPELVMEIITRKTGIPLGEVSGEEQKKLLGLEEFLAKRVIGQNEAVRAVSDAIRRARSGIQNPKRPIGTFLFLGPTGVGKTETAKALAETYFGNEESMARFDMTEYQSEEGFEKLVGSFEKNEPGLLTSRMHFSPYALVLLDEFEKCSAGVKNLFLQVLDEGFFTDHLGRKVNMRNTIIIATSNAGSKLIWELVQKGTDPASVKNELFSYIQKEGIYSPELLNRFDAVVIFSPLKPETLSQIARLGLEKLRSRLKKSKNIKLVITEPLINAVASGGYDPVFGARPMQRFIQDKVEKLIADKIIKGELKSGGEFSFSPEELALL
ncbi:MAG: ATP-dependent Clp protease ATP-binding subunit [Candidatus Sungbacteria bacterium]|nr:ATP-dependent Clp protease ATP-binding subunit [Candidatus Sungbacteria bacterium]